MNTAKLRMQGNEQLAILPDCFQLVVQEVYIKKVGNAIILISKNNPWQTLWNSLDLFSDDFMETREQPPLQAKDMELI
jgi:antitoxin VapB